MTKRQEMVSDWMIVLSDLSIYFEKHQQKKILFFLINKISINKSRQRYFTSKSQHNKISKKHLDMSKKDNFFFKDINENVLSAQYAVRGVVPTRANEIKEDLKLNPSKYPFKEVTFCNIGNPQDFGQQPISFNRQVISCMANPDLLEDRNMNIDARQRAKWFLSQMNSVGSYTHSLGVPIIRESVAKFIEQNDQVERPSINDVILTEGASQGVHLLTKMLITSANDGIMIPIPQYPLYSASTVLYGGKVIPYYLDEESGWQLDDQELENSYRQAEKEGIKPRALVVINPGNPTGAIFSQETIRKIIKFGISKKLLIIADEVYRENIYKENAKFYSFRKVLNKMGKQASAICELASMHSVSKGLLGQCGFRGGYLYIHNFSDKVRSELTKLKSISLCSNSLGQAMVELMVHPPLEGVSQQTKKQYLGERKKLFDSLKARAQLVTKYLNQMKNVTSHECEGAMYAFPNIKFSPKVIQVSKGKPDLFYCLEVLKHTGIALVPGSGFRQKPGTYHFRITTLIRPEEKLKEKLELLKAFNDEFHAKYETKGNL